MIVAEELGVDWDQVKTEYADANRNLKEDSVYGNMNTGGSRSVRVGRPALQLAGATAREQLIKAAAMRWETDPKHCVASGGKVSWNGKSLNYGELAADAVLIDVGDVAIKEPTAYELIGQPTLRVEVPLKVNGSAIYGMDVRLDGMVYAAIKHCPVIGGTVESYNDDSLQDLPGFIQVVNLETAVAVVADHYWQAQTAVDALVVDWNKGSGAGTSTKNWEAEFRAALDEEGVDASETQASLDEIETALEASDSTLTADYFAPYLAHTCMEPLNCTVHVQDDRVDIWTGTQNPEGATTIGAETSGISTDNVYTHNCFLGGGFGRRSNTDYVGDAVRIGMQAKRPVQLIWSRKEDVRQGRFRPMSAIRFTAGFDEKKESVALANHSVTHSILAGINRWIVRSGIDPTSVEGLAEIPYAIPKKRATHTIKNTHLTTWFWRSVGSSQNAFAMESFVDEMAVHADADPFAFRLSLLEEEPDLSRVLEVLREKSGWGKNMASGRAQGLAIHESFGSIVGQVADVHVTRTGKVKVERVVSVVDCGHLVNPLTAGEQVESGIMYGLTAALFGEIRVRDGAVVESNFHNYEIARMIDAPEMDTHFSLAGGDKWGGMGEPGLPPLAPAVCNAIFRVTGKRVRSLPLSRHDLSWA
tara:strand:- start:250 stop:2181 length:1932 start_codon:yes stop_codon:yes gene_type:complete